MSMTTVIPAIVKIASLQRLFGRDKSTLHRWIQTGEWARSGLPAIQTIGGIRYVRIADLETYVGRPITTEDLDLEAAS